MVLSGAQLDSVALSLAGLSRGWWETDDSVRERMDSVMSNKDMPSPKQERLIHRPYWLLRRLY